LGHRLRPCRGILAIVAVILVDGVEVAAAGQESALGLGYLGRLASDDNARDALTLLPRASYTRVAIRAWVLALDARHVAPLAGIPLHLGRRAFTHAACALPLLVFGFCRKKKGITPLSASFFFLFLPLLTEFFFVFLCFCFCFCFFSKR